MTTLTFRNSRGELVDIPTVPATKAVLISYAEFESLMKSRSPALEDLSAQFDGLLQRMQTPGARKGMKAAFNAAPAGLGRAAVRAAAKKNARTRVAALRRR